MKTVWVSTYRWATSQRSRESVKTTPVNTSAPWQVLTHTHISCGPEESLCCLTPEDTTLSTTSCPLSALCVWTELVSTCGGFTDSVSLCLGCTAYTICRYCTSVWMCLYYNFIIFAKHEPSGTSFPLEGRNTHDNQLKPTETQQATL